MTRRSGPSRAKKASLPPAAQRWLERCVPADAPSPDRAWVGQRGSMDADGKWLSFTATGTLEARPLLYDWRARLRLRLGVWMLAKDGYSGDEGWTGAWLYGIKSLGQRSGPGVLLMQVIRNLAELAWVPDLAKGEPSLEWVDTGQDAFEIRTRAGKRKVAVRFDVDAHGDIIRASSPSRPYASPDGPAEAPWRCDFAEPREFGGVRIPSTVVATYERGDGPWEYFRGEVTSVDRQLQRK
ncbi:MAG: DUF6544 family protein [Chloroflexota bacterium]